MSEVYTHRNGETEPPTILEKFYWFRASMGSYYEATFGCYYIMPADGNKGPYLHDDDTEISKLEGQWWGPVTPPWEQD